MNTLKRNIPNLITLSNLFCGCVSIIYASNNQLEYAALFIFIGILFQGLLIYACWLRPIPEWQMFHELGPTVISSSMLYTATPIDVEGNTTPLDHEIINQGEGCKQIYHPKNQIQISKQSYF